MKVGKIVIVEDSPTARVFLRNLVEEVGFEVVGMAEDGLQGEEVILQQNPTLVLSDIHMPEADGIQMTTRLMRSHPVPIVLITAHDPTNPDLVFRAMQAGALEVLPKPPGRNNSEFEKYKKQFANTLKVLSGLPVVKRFEPTIRKSRKYPRSPRLLGKPVIAIGASTGGPALIASLLKSLDKDAFHFAVIAQHIVPDFLPSFCDWLRTIAHLPVKIVENGETPAPGFVYIAPPRFHLKYEPDGKWKVLPATAVAAPHIPSIDMLFESLTSFHGRKVAAVLLTGMGSDGAYGLRKLRESGAITVVQEPGSAVVASMPMAAIRQKAASFILYPAEIESWLASY